MNPSSNQQSFTTEKREVFSIFNSVSLSIFLNKKNNFLDFFCLPIFSFQREKRTLSYQIWLSKKIGRNMSSYFPPFPMQKNKKAEISHSKTLFSLIFFHTLYEFLFLRKKKGGQENEKRKTPN